MERCALIFDKVQHLHLNDDLRADRQLLTGCIAKDIARGILPAVPNSLEDCARLAEMKKLWN